MGLTKSITSSATRGIVSRMSSMLTNSPRLQGLIKSGSDLIAPDGPGKSAATNALLNVFKEKGMSMLQEHLSNINPGSLKGMAQPEKGSSTLMKAAMYAMPALALAVTLLSKLTDSAKNGLAALERKQQQGTNLDTLIAPAAGTNQPAVNLGTLPTPLSSTAPAGAALTGTPLGGLIQAGTAAPGSDPAYTAWVAQERTSRANFAATEAQLRAKTNYLELLKTDQRLRPDNETIPDRIKEAERHVEGARKLHVEQMDQRVAVIEAGKQFGYAAETILKNEPLPADWNRPKDFIPKDMDTPKADLPEISWNEYPSR